jgi:cytochrome c oxidase assembly protein subunit 15
MRDRLQISPRAYAVICLVALGAMSLIVLTGAAVRLSGSGLGCPDWPKCYGKAYAPLETHALIEFGNRMLTGLVGTIAILAGALAWFRTPPRRTLKWLAVLLPLGVVAQAVLGGITVRTHLAYEAVMAHYFLSMMLLDATVALAWCATHEPGWRPFSTERRLTWATRALLPLGAITIIAGTAATAAGPHPGDDGGRPVGRLHVKGTGTLDWAIANHSKLALGFGVLAVALWAITRRRGLRARNRPLTVLVGLLLAQGAVGFTQYQLHLPAELVWVHIALATATWLAVLWSVAEAGRLVPREQHVPDAPVAEQAPQRSVAKVG